MNNLEFIDEFLEEQSVFERSPTTIKNYRYTLLKADKTIDKPFTELTTADIKKFLSSLNGGKKSSKILYLQHLNKFTDWLMEEKGIKFEKHPVKRAKRELLSSRQEQTIKEIPTVEQVSRLVKMALEPMSRVIVLLLYKTGIREGELVGINIEDVDLQKCRILIKASTSKNKKDRWVYIDNELKLAIEDWLSYRKNLGSKDNALIITQRRTRVSKLHVWLIIKNLGKQAHEKYGDSIYQEIHPHLFRHTFTSHLAKNRILIKALQILRGDEDKSMVDLYTHLTDEEVKQEYLKAIPILGL